MFNEGIEEGKQNVDQNEEVRTKSSLKKGGVCLWIWQDFFFVGDFSLVDLPPALWGMIAPPFPPFFHNSSIVSACTDFLCYSYIGTRSSYPQDIRDYWKSITTQQSAREIRVRLTAGRAQRERAERREQKARKVSGVLCLGVPRRTRIIYSRTHCPPSNGHVLVGEYRAHGASDNF